MICAFYHALHENKTAFETLNKYKKNKHELLQLCLSLKINLLSGWLKQKKKKTKKFFFLSFEPVKNKKKIFGFQFT